LDIRALRYFVEVVQRQSYTAAARALFVTQPTVSKMIRQLEDELGTPVLLKQGRRIEPTDTGRVVLRRGSEILALHTQLQAELADLKRTARGELAMGVPPLASDLLTPLLTRYHQEYPNIELRLFERGSRTLDEDLRAGTLEIGAMMLPADEDEYENLPICNYPLQLMAPLSSKWARRQSVRLAELAGEPFIFYGEGFALNETVHDACVRAGFTPIVAGRSSQWDFMASMVAAGVGLALLPALFTRRLEGRCAVVALEDPQIWWHMALVWRRGRYLSHAARAWLDLARIMLPVQT
jgi:DNA-binding transcriptional LysR family regulator